MADICWSTPKKRLVFSWKSSEPDHWRERALARSVSEFEAWDAKMRRRFGLIRTIKWLPKHTGSNGRKTLASLHWPHRNCWSWFVEWSRVHDECRGLKLCCAYRQFALVLWWYQVAIHWQTNMTSVASQYRDEAPEIIFKHDVERALYQKRMKQREGQTVG